VAILSGLQAKTTTIALQSFGTILYTDSYAAQGLSKQDAKHHLSLLFLVSNMLSVITGLIFGYLSDKIKIYKLIQIVNFILMASLSMLIQQILSCDENLKLGLFFDLNYILVFGVHTCSYMLGVSYLAKICGEQTRGTMFGFNGIIGSIGVSVMNGTGGVLYRDVSKAGPFATALLGYVILALLTAVFAFTNKLKA
jgi:MFS family permease